jgi:membrane protein DedA with SNARE-associated domain
MDALLDSYGLVAVCVVLFLKGTGIPIPIPGDVLLLGTAAQTANGRFLLWQAFVAVLLAILLGSTVQFLLARGSGRRLVYRFGRHLGLTAGRLDAVAARVRRSGIIGIAVMVLTPGVRSAAIPACGLAAVPWRTFVPGLVVGSSLDLVLHFALGFAGGSLLMGLFDPSLVPWIVVGVLLLFALAGVVAWRLLRARQRGGHQTQLGASAFEAWQQAVCPVCLGVGAALAPDGVMRGARPVAPPTTA